MKDSTKTRVQILTFGLVLGVVGLLAVFALTNARAQARDAVRLSDVRQTQVGLELYYLAQNEYPFSSSGIPLGSETTRCIDETGFAGTCTGTIYQQTLAIPPSSGLKELVSCAEEKNAYCYIGGTTGYRIEFELERGSSLLGLAKGLNCATETGWAPGECSSLPRN